MYDVIDAIDVIINKFGSPPKGLVIQDSRVPGFKDSSDTK